MTKRSGRPGEGFSLDGRAVARGCSRRRAPSPRPTTAPAGSSSPSRFEDGAGTPPTQRGVRVPPGVTVFDSASWNGIAIDSTCGGHGTCHKCKVRVRGGDADVTRHDVKTFTRDQLDAGLAARLPGAGDPRPRGRGATTHHPAQGRDRRHRATGDPAAGYAEALRRADEADLSDQRTDLDRLTDAIDDLELTADLHVLRRLSTVLREADFKVTAVIIDEALIDVEPGDTTAARYAIAFDLGTTTVVGTLLDVAPARRSRSRRRSTSSSRSAET